MYEFLQQNAAQDPLVPTPQGVAPNDIGCENDFDNTLNELICDNDDKVGIYISCCFILGTAVEVGRLWRLCKYVFTDIRQAPTQQLFEVIIFLKVNTDYWDQNIVTKAYINYK